jgi:predicted CoA-binding protein
MNKTTLVLGASTKTHRYSNMAARELLRNGNDVVLIGNREGEINNIPILKSWPEVLDIHSITMYLSARNQKAHYEEILKSGAERIIFNPGAENHELAGLAVNQGIAVENACTLVLLATQQY